MLILRVSVVGTLGHKRTSWYCLFLERGTWQTGNYSRVSFIPKSVKSSLSRFFNTPYLFLTVLYVIDHSSLPNPFTTFQTLSTYKPHKRKLLRYYRIKHREKRQKKPKTTIGHCTGLVTDLYSCACSNSYCGCFKIDGSSGPGPKIAHQQRHVGMEPNRLSLPDCRLLWTTSCD